MQPHFVTGLVASGQFPDERPAGRFPNDRQHGSSSWARLLCTLNRLALAWASCSVSRCVSARAVSRSASARSARNAVRGSFSAARRGSVGGGGPVVPRGGGGSAEGVSLGSLGRGAVASQWGGGRGDFGGGSGQWPACRAGAQ